MMFEMVNARLLWLGAICCNFAIASDLDGPAAKYLSDHRFPGLHIIEIQGQALSLYPEGEKIISPLAPMSLSVEKWKRIEDARRALEVALRIPKREKYQSEWAMFDAQGHRIEDIQQMLSEAVVFVSEIGQWMWPGVRVGFERLVEGVDGDTPKLMRTLSLRPVVFQIEDFIQPIECDEVIRLGKNSGLVSSKGIMQSRDLQKGTADNSFRTSKQAWLPNEISPTVDKLDGRVANLTRVDRLHNEPVQVLRYDEGGFYHGHNDWSELELYPDQPQLWRDHHFGHQDRLATVFWYLNDVSVGGETAFLKHGHVICPDGQRNCEGAPEPEMHRCDVAGLKSKPIRGNVILWYNFHANGRGDRNSLHTGCPVGKGLVKWSGNKWISIKRLDIGQVPWDASHPALKRYHWTGDVRRVDPNKCSISFENRENSAVDIFWFDAHSGKESKVLSLEPGAGRNLDSYKGHQFKVRASSGSQSSSAVVCDPNGGVFVIEAGLSLRWIALPDEVVSEL